MSLKTQTANMKTLAKLLSHNLGYIFGERENGPNGAKSEFLTKARVFLSALGKDLGLVVQKVHTNKAGIAVSGEVTLRGLWKPGNGLCVELSQDLMNSHVLHYGPIYEMNDYSTGFVVYVSLDTLRRANYARLILDLMIFKEDFRDDWTAA